MTTNAEFLTELARDLPDDERLIVCSFPGDPNGGDFRNWTALPWRPGGKVPAVPANNNYVAVSSFRRASDELGFRRRADAFAAGRALMVDDVGEKVPASTLDALAPTALVATSAESLQAWYFLAEPCRDREKFDAAIRGFVASDLCPAGDPGMAGVNRVGRLPVGVNGKPHRANSDGSPWLVECRGWAPDRRYTLEEIARAFGTSFVFRQRPIPGTGALYAREHAAEFIEMFRTLRDFGLLTGGRSPTGGFDLVCPWVARHTKRAKTGTAIFPPSPDNGWRPGFKCHHSGCTGKSWRHLAEWVAERCAENLQAASDAAVDQTMTNEEMDDAR